MSEAVQMALLAFLGTALGAILVAGPQWLKARAEERRANVETEGVSRTMEQQANDSAWKQVERDRDRAEVRDIAREKQIDTLRAELLLERAQRYTERNLQDATLAEERKLRRELASQIDNERTNRNHEIEALRSSAGETIANLTKQVAQLEVTIAELKNIIADLQARLDQEHNGRLAAEKRVDELEAQIARLLQTQTPKGTEAQ